MPNKEHLALINQGVDAWNEWRCEHEDTRPDLSRANLSCADLSGANLREAYLSEADLSRADLGEAKLSRATLISASLVETDFTIWQSSLQWSISPSWWAKL